MLFRLLPVHQIPKRIILVKEIKQFCAGEDKDNLFINYNAVPDFSCSVNVWTEPEEALKVLGLL
jgi:hypothetical protein